MCSDLVQWIEQALKEAMRENGERGRMRMNATEAVTATSEGATPPASPRSSGSALVLRADMQYRRHPVNGRVIPPQTQALTPAYISNPRKSFEFTYVVRKLL